MNAITVAEAGPIMAKALGHDWAKDRREVVDYLNKYRSLLYTEYDKFKLFDDVFHCICVTDFAQGCVSECNEAAEYRGFTLPNDVLGVESVWSYGVPLSVHSRWRESHTGIAVSGEGSIRTLLMADFAAHTMEADV